MENLTVRVYTTHRNYRGSRAINLNRGELEEIIGRYLKEEYLKEDEILDSIDFEDIKL